MEFLSYHIVSNDFNQAGNASRALKGHLKRIGVDPEAIRRTMIAAYEAEMNVVIHGQGGLMEAHLADEALHVDVMDNGPGIPDITMAMKEGYSTANAEARALGFGAGMGLPNIKRSSDRLRVTSRVDKGTRVSFTVYFRKDTTRPPHFISLQASPELCQDCGRCLAACPTQAIRIRDHVPIVIESLCIDCGACIAACKHEALMIRNDISSLDDLHDLSETALIFPPAMLTDCGARYRPQQVLAAVEALGFKEIASLVSYERALRRAATKMAREKEGAAPVIMPVCPAAVNLIELRFPSLIEHLAPFDSPIEAAQSDFAGRPAVYVVSCPSQRSCLITHEVMAGILPGQETITEFVTPAILRQAIMEQLVTGAGDEAAPDEVSVEETGTDETDDGEITMDSTSDALVVTGLRHVTAVLEELEDGMLGDFAVIEPYACPGGCFGSPFCHEDFHVSIRRYEEACGATGCANEWTDPVERRLPFTARPGIRLDADVNVAMEKLEQVQTILELLPGKDCSVCGAPSCATLAEDIVLGRASLEDCPYLDEDKGRSER